MTTAVTVNAHAGWPVRVLTQHYANDSQSQPTGAPVETIVPANTERVFYIHGSMNILSISEMKRDASSS